MKKSYIGMFYAAICVGLAVLASACGGNDKAATEEAFVKLGSSEDLVVATGNLADVLTNAACAYGDQGITLTPQLGRIIDKGASPREKAQIEKALKIRGVDFNGCFLKVNADEESIIALGLTDAKAFREWITEDMGVEAPESEGEYEVYGLEKNVKIFANERAAYIVSSNSKECTLEHFNELKAQAEASPLAEWQTKALGEGRTFTALVSGKHFTKMVGEETLNQAGTEYIDIEAIKNGYAEVTAELRGKKLNVTIKARDREGNQVKAKQAIKPIDMDIFKYINKGDNLAAAVSLPEGMDWNTVIAAIDQQMGGNLTRGANKMIMNKVAEVLGNVDGTVFVSAHPKNLLMMTSGPQYWSLTLGAKMKKGSAAGYINEIKTLASSYGIGSKAEGDATVIELAPFKFYLKDVAGMLVISTEAITGEGGSIFSKEYFKGQMLAIEASLAEGTSLPGVPALTFQPIVALSTDGSQLAFDVEVVGEGEYLLDTLIRYIAEASN
ncbi:MAG: hypothetical protein NC102_06780 [Clostridium sp.]|nr:hypothetical protein [Clostridium sp.]